MSDLVSAWRSCPDGVVATDGFPYIDFQLLFGFFVHVFFMFCSVVCLPPRCTFLRVVAFCVVPALRRPPPILFPPLVIEINTPSVVATS